MNMTEAVKQLLIINIIFFVGANFVGDFAYQLLSMHYIENKDFKFWQPLTYMFMHAPVYKGIAGNLMHIVFNMFALVSFGAVLEQFWGSKKFLFFYVSCGLGALALHIGINYIQIHSLMDEVASLNFTKSEWQLILNSDYRSLFDNNGKLIAGPVKTILENAHCTQEQFNVISEAIYINKGTMIGASGAVYGLLVAFAFMFPNAQLGLMFIPVPIKAKYFVPGLLAIDLFLGLKGSSIFGSGGTGIAHFAHIGGALIGFLMMWYWKKNSFNNKRWN